MIHIKEPGDRERLETIQRLAEAGKSQDEIAAGAGFESKWQLRHWLSKRHITMSAESVLRSTVSGERLAVGETPRVAQATPQDAA